MSSDNPRWVVVDDTNTNITYTGSSWFQDTGSQDTAGNFGPAYRSTLHGTKANASLSYSFSGTRVQVFGSNNLRNDSGVLDPKWECFIDQISIGSTTPFQFAENNWVFCEHDGLVNGPHVLTVNATVNREQTFWFDSIRYVPSPSVRLDNEAILIDNLDPGLGYGPGWGALGGTANMTTVQSSVFDFDFYGVSLSWYSFIPTELPHAATTATYSVDGESPVNFLLKGLSGDGTIYNQKFFETKTYPAGPHRISVVYQGSGQVTPLTLDYLIVQNGTAATSSTTSSGPSGTNGASTGGSGNVNGGGEPGKSTNIGAIVGGVVGGLVLILLAVLAFVFLRRRDRRRRKEVDLYDEAPHVVQPFQYTPVNAGLPPHHTYPSSGTLTYTQPYQTAQIGSGFGTSTGSHHATSPSYTASEMQSVVAPSSSGASNTGATTMGHNPKSTKAQREAEATAAALRVSNTAGQSGRVVSPPVSDVSGNSRVVMHEDSGLRYPDADAPVNVVEVPPRYTPG